MPRPACSLDALSITHLARRPTVSTEQTTPEPAPRTPRMPPVWRGRRRAYLGGLVGLGVAQAVLALVMSFSVDGVLSHTATPAAGAERTVLWSGMITLLGAVLGIGLARWFERILAEKLGQDYVYEQRRRLITAALNNVGNRSLGVIVTRASNDLTAVRNWIAQGIVPLATALPLIATVLLVLAVTRWTVALAILVPLALLAGALPLLSELAHRRARTLRRHRGRMSAHISDTVRAGESIRVAGAMQRELNAVDRNSARVVEAAVSRARVTGFIRSLTITAASLCTVAVVFLAQLGLIGVAEVASIMTLLGVMATPLGDLGRVVEYRQNYRAARRILAPLLSAATALDREHRRRERQWRTAPPEPEAGHRGLSVDGLAVNGHALPPLTAVPGTCVELRSAHPAQIRATLLALFDAHYDGPAPDARVLINGINAAAAPEKTRRELIGYGSGRIPLERGSVARLAAYRVPRALGGEVRWMLARVGLQPLLDASPRGLQTKLTNDGSPWRGTDVARLKLARAMLGTPPLLVLEHLDTELDADGRTLLRDLVADYPGVVLLVSSHPEQISASRDVWELDGADADERAATAERLRAASRSSDAETDDTADDE